MANRTVTVPLSALTLAALLAGCAGPPLVGLKSPGFSVAESEATTTAMTLPEARKLLFRLRATYREAMAEQLNTTQMSSSTLVGLGVLVAGLAAGRAHPDAIVGASLIGGGSYAIAGLTLDRRRVLAFDAGIRALDCAHAAVIPLDLDTTQLQTLAEASKRLGAARTVAAAAAASAQSALDAATKEAAAEAAPLATAAKSIAAVNAALVEADKSRKAADKLSADTREVGRRLHNTVLAISAKVDGVIAATVPDVSAVQQVLGGLGGFASAFAPGAGIDQTLADALGRYNKATPPGAKSASDTAQKLESALKTMDTAATELIAATTAINEALAPVDGAAVVTALKACNVADVVLPLALEPTTLALEAKAGAGKGFAISGGSKPYSVRLLDAPAEGLAITFAGGLSDTAIVAANDKVPADSYRLLVNDAIGNSRQLVVNVGAKAAPPPTPAADPASAPASAPAPAPAPAPTASAAAATGTLAGIADKLKGLAPIKGPGFDIAVVPASVKVVGSNVQVEVLCTPTPAADKKAVGADLASRLNGAAQLAGAKAVQPNPVRVVNSSACVK